MDKFKHTEIGIIVDKSKATKTLYNNILPPSDYYSNNIKTPSKKSNCLFYLCLLFLIILFTSGILMVTTSITSTPFITHSIERRNTMADSKKKFNIRFGVVNEKKRMEYEKIFQIQYGYELTTFEKWEAIFHARRQKNKNIIVEKIYDTPKTLNNKIKIYRSGKGD